MDIRVGLSFLEDLDTNNSVPRLTFNKYNIIYFLTQELLHLEKYFLLKIV